MGQFSNFGATFLTVRESILSNVCLRLTSSPLPFCLLTSFPSLPFLVVLSLSPSLCVIPLFTWRFTLIRCYSQVSAVLTAHCSAWLVRKADPLSCAMYRR